MTRIGLIVNPVAGTGLPTNGQVARDVSAILTPAVVVTGPGNLGAAFVAHLTNVHVCPVTASPGRQQTLELTERLTEAGVDLLVVVGGDGTLADVALALVRLGRDVPVLGVGAGSTNVGNLLTCHKDDMDNLARAPLTFQKVDALLASCNGELLGVGFNDCVIGYTVLATVAGQVIDVDATAKMAGHNVPGTPRPVWTERTVVRKSGPQGEVVVAQGTAVGTVVVGLAEGRFFGKAVAGGICLAVLVGATAGCLVCEQPLVRVRLNHTELARMEPIASRFASLSEEEEIVVEGVRSGAALCVDGTPVKRLCESDRVQLGVRRAAVTAVRLERKVT